VGELELYSTDFRIPRRNLYFFWAFYSYKRKLLLFVYFELFRGCKWSSLFVRSNRHRKNFNIAANNKSLECCKSAFHLHSSNFSKHCPNSVGIEISQSKKSGKHNANPSTGKKVHLRDWWYLNAKDWVIWGPASNWNVEVNSKRRRCMGQKEPRF